MSELIRICTSRFLPINKYNEAYFVFGDFFLGEVILINQGVLNAKYRIEDNSSIIKVKNSLHIRLEKLGFPFFDFPFKIVAPIEAVKVEQGNIPSNCISNLSAGDYLDYKMTYQV